MKGNIKVKLMWRGGGGGGAWLVQQKFDVKPKL